MAPKGEQLRSARYYGIPAEVNGNRIVRFMANDNPKDIRVLPLRDDLAEHADGFDWGFPVLEGGIKSKAMTAGAAQLALALCCHALADDDRGMKLHQRFKLRVMQNWANDQPWSITAEEIAAMCDVIQADEIAPDKLAHLNREKGPVEHERGRGVDPTMRGIAWDTKEDGVMGSRMFGTRGSEDD